jgi:hypothetical protein
VSAPFAQAWVTFRAQGKLETPHEVLFSEWFAVSEIREANFWAHQAATGCDAARRTSTFALFTTSWDNDDMPNATITVDGALKGRLADLASQTGQRVDEFVETLLRRIANTDVRFDRGVPVFPRRPGAPTLSVEDVDRLADGAGE